MIFFNNWQFFHFSLLGKIGQEKVFCDILDRKNASLDYKNKVKKVKKLGFFQSGYSMICVKNWQFFHLFI